MKTKEEEDQKKKSKKKKEKKKKEKKRKKKKRKGGRQFLMDLNSYLGHLSAGPFPAFSCYTLQPPTYASKAKK